MQSLISYFIPILRNVPVFGTMAAKHWLWAFDLSPAYFGYGIIIGPSVNIAMLLGAILGWGVLSPIAKHREWAPGLVGDWNNGARAWIVLVGMGLILGDSAIGLGWVICKPLVPWVLRQINDQLSKTSRNYRVSEETALLNDGFHSDSENDETDSFVDDDWPKSARVTTKLLLWSGVTFLFLYLITFLGFFRNLTSPLATLVALLLVPLAGFISMRSLGETDNGAVLALGTLIR